MVLGRVTTTLGLLHTLLAMLVVDFTKLLVLEDFKRRVETHKRVVCIGVVWVLVWVQLEGQPLERPSNLLHKYQQARATTNVTQQHRDSNKERLQRLELLTLKGRRPVPCQIAHTYTHIRTLVVASSLTSSSS